MVGLLKKELEFICRVVAYVISFFRIVYPIYLQDRCQQQQAQHHQRHSFIDSSASSSSVTAVNNNSGQQHEYDASPHKVSSTHHTESESNTTLTNYDEYDDIDDNESVDKSLFQRHQSDNVSLANSLFTAVDHLEIEDDDDQEERHGEEQEEEDDEEDDDDSSTENLRHGHLPTQPYHQDHESINSYIKQLNVETSIVWEGNSKVVITLFSSQ